MPPPSPEPAQGSPFAVGRVLGGRYRLIEPIGQGGMGAVYAAVQLDLARRVAVKVLLDDTTHEDILRFRQEALAAAALRHPNIVQVTDFRHDPGEPPFIVMEALDGESLRQLLYRDRTLPAPRALFITKQILAALGAAHAARIIHRDIKPANVFLGRTDAVADLVKVLDFGIAKMLGKGTQGVLTREGEVHGTPAYMAPEQILESAVDHRADIHAVGVCLFEMLSGQRPYYGATAHETFRAIVRDPPRRLLDCAPHVDPHLAAIVDRAVAKDPAQRPQSAAAFIDSLAPLSAGVATAPIDLQKQSPAPPLPPAQLTAPLTASTSTLLGGPAFGAPPPRDTQTKAPERAIPTLALVSAAVSLVAFLGCAGLFVAWRVMSRPVEGAGAWPIPGVTGVTARQWSSLAPPLPGSFVGDDTEDYAGIVSDDFGDYQHGMFAVFDGATHKIVWAEKQDEQYAEATSYAAVADVIAVTTSPNEVTVYDAATGDVRVVVEMPRNIRELCAPVGAKKAVWVDMGSSGAMIDVETGTPSQRAAAPDGCSMGLRGDLDGPPFCRGRACGEDGDAPGTERFDVDAHRSLITRTDANSKADLSLFDKTDAKEKLIWVRDIPLMHEPLLDVGGGRVISKRGKEYAIGTGVDAWDLETGAPLWSWEGKSFAIWPGTVVEVRATRSRIYVNRRGGLTILDAKSGKEIRTLEGI